MGMGPKCLVSYDNYICSICGGTYNGPATVLIALHLLANVVLTIVQWDQIVIHYFTKARNKHQRWNIWKILADG